MKQKIFLLFLLIIYLSACSSVKVKIAPDKKDDGFRSLAVLPVEYPSEIQREKVDAIYEAVQLELKNAGFIVLADKIVRAVCSTPACPEKQQLASKYLVDGFVTLEVRSISRTNLLLGFYNEMSGTLHVSDKAGTEVVLIERNERERGGLLFNSGQLIRGLVSTFENTEQASFTKLSAGLAQSLASNVPHSKTTGVDSDATAVSIGDVDIKEVSPQVFEVCSKSAPNVLVSVIINRQRTNLREVSPTKYCGSFLLDPTSTASSKLKVEARSPFGNSVQKELDIAKYVEDCNLKDRVYLKLAKGKPSIEITCSANNKCDDDLKSCSSHRFLVFRAPSTVGPFEKVAELRGRSWVDSQAKSGQTKFYQLVTVSRSGVWSLPEAAKPVSGEG